jgi:predicted RNase H-like HicB family nuclease
MAPDEMGSMKRNNSSQRALVAYLCHFRPEPEGGFTVTCPKLPPVVTYGETLEEAQANAREAIKLCLEVMREDGQPIPPPRPGSRLADRSAGAGRHHGRMRALRALVLFGECPPRKGAHAQNTLSVTPAKAGVQGYR